MRWWQSAVAFGLVLVGAACGGDEVAPPTDGGAPTPDAGMDAGPPPVDGGHRGDGGFDYPDAGPPPTGCYLLDGAVPAADGGEVDAGPLTPDGHPAVGGPGAPSLAFDASELGAPCAYLDGGDQDRDHHNTVLIFDGYLYMPWAHEAGFGGISVFDVHDACNPVALGTTIEERMRETHAVGVTTMGGRFMVTTSLEGILFWDVSDPIAPRVVSNMTLPEVTYPDAYRRVVLSTFWQAPYVYVGAADNGVFIVDARDPTAPELVGTYEPTPDMRVGNVHAVGNLLVIHGTEGSRTNLVDIGDPASPRAIPGGSFIISDGTTDRFGRPTLKTFYFGHFNGNRTYYARNTLGGGLVVYDVSDRTLPTFLGNWDAPPVANGGYVFVKEGIAFVGLSDYGAAIDVTSPTALTMVRRFEMTGDLDTIVPIGNVVVISVDDDAIANQASEVVPFAEARDTRPPVVNMVDPPDGTVDVPLTARVGVTFDEFVDLVTVYRGSFRVEARGTGVPLEGTYSGQEGAVNFWPDEPLRPATIYDVIIPAGGVTDVSGNPIAAEHRSSFTTVSCD